MSRARVRISGITRLKVRLENLGDDLKAELKDAVKASAEAVRDDVRATVPVASGHLRDTVDIRYEDDGLTAQVGWFDPTSHYATFVEHGTRRRPAHPVLGPALKRERPRMRDRISDEVRQVLR